MADETFTHGYEVSARFPEGGTSPRFLPGAPYGRFCAMTGSSARGSITELFSELLGDTSLLQNAVCGVPRQNFVVHREVPLRDRAVPNLVIATSGSIITTTMGAKDVFQFRRVADHQDPTGTEAVSS